MCTAQLGCLAPSVCGEDYCRHEHSTMSCTSHAAVMTTRDALCTAHGARRCTICV